VDLFNLLFSAFFDMFKVLADSSAFYVMVCLTLLCAIMGLVFFCVFGRRS